MQVYTGFFLACTFFSLDFSVFPISAHSHCSCIHSSSLHPSPCSLGSPAVLLQVLPSSQSLFPVCSDALGHPGKCRIFPSGRWYDWSLLSATWSRTELGHLNSLLNKCLKHRTISLYHHLGPVLPKIGFLDAHGLLMTQESAKTDHLCSCWLTWWTCSLEDSRDFVLSVTMAQCDTRFQWAPPPALTSFLLRRWRSHHTIHMLLLPLCLSRESTGKCCCAAR